jgi:peptidoglycan/LPS O-acetylase OafA/YrhL
MNTLSDWARSLWLDPITPSIVASHATLLLKTNTHAIDPVVWSLIIEMRMSLLLPLFIYLLGRTHGTWWQSALMVGVFVLAALTDKLMFFPHFALGACLAKNYSYFQHIFGKMSRIAVLGVALIIICLYGNRWILNLGSVAILQNYLTALVSIFLIVAATNSTRLSIALQSSIFSFLAKTSYSFYLLHLPILLVAVSLIYPATQSLVLAIGVALIASYGLSICIYYVIEVPAIRLGKVVAAKVKI